MAWRQPDHIMKNIEMLGAFKIILKYLTAPKVSPLAEAFMEIEPPLATTISYTILEFKEPAVLIEFENIPIEKIDLVVPTLEETLRKVVSEDAEAFDLNRVHNDIKRKRRNAADQVENNPHRTLIYDFIIDLLYGESPNDLQKLVASNVFFENYLSKDASYWKNIIEDVLIKLPKITVKGMPRLDKHNNINRPDENIVKDPIKEPIQKRICQVATKRSQKLPGSDLLNDFPTGDVNSIKFTNFKSCDRMESEDLSIQLRKFPIKIHFDDIATDFVQFNILFSTASLTSHQRLLIPLILECWTHVPTKRNNSLIDVKDMDKLKAKNFVHHSVGLGLSNGLFFPGEFSETCKMSTKFEIKKFLQAMELLHDLINYPHFTIKAKLQFYHTKSFFGTLYQKLKSLKP